MARGVFQKGRIAGSFNFRLLFSCFIMGLSQVNFGLDQTAFSTTQAMGPFERKFGVYRPSLKRFALEPYFLSLLNSLPTITQVFGLLMGSFICRRFGRRMSFFVMCGWAWLSAILNVTAQNKEQILAGRMINFIYIGMELAAVPVTQSELVPARVRGFVVGTYQLGIMTGGLIMSLICLGTSKIKNENSFRIPFGIFFVIPTIVFLGTFWMPESPRWLLLKNRPEEARKNLQLLREGKFTDEEIEREFQDLKMGIELTTEKGSFAEQWKGTHLRRTLIVLGVNFFLQMTGQNFTSKYGAVFIKDVGAVDPFVMKTITTLCGILMVLTSMLISDTVGRKTIMNIGSFFQAAAVMTIGGLGSIPNPSRNVGVGITALTVVFASGFCIGWAPNSHVVAAEIPAMRLRDMTYSTGSVVNVLCSFVVTFTLPYLMYEPYAALGPKVGFIYGSFAVLSIVFVWLALPECKGLSLEEIEHLFESGVPTRKFGSYKHGEILPAEVEPEAKEARVIQAEVKPETAV